MQPSMSVVATQSLLQALIKNIDASNQSSTHLIHSEFFLKEIKSRLEWYNDLLFKLSANPQHAENLIMAIGEINKVVYKLVETIKGMCEGTTDSIPFALAAYLNYECDALLNSPNIRVAMCPIPNMNYFYRNIGKKISTAINNLDRWIYEDVLYDEALNIDVKKAEEFPSNLLLIGFQYSMVDDVLFNAVLFHELGHHVYNEHVLNKLKLKDRLDERLKEFKTQNAGKGLNGTVDVIITNYEKLLNIWAAELFSDAFAVVIGGPQYAFAIDDLMRVIPKKRAETFHATHPSDIVRKQVQWSVVNELGWMKNTSGFNTDFTMSAMKLFETLSPPSLLALGEWNIDDLSNMYSNPDIIRSVIEELILLIPTIKDEAINFVKNSKSRAQEFWCLGSEVNEAFERAIVPSTIITKKKLGCIDDAFTPVKIITSGTYEYSPQPCTVMNVARVIAQTGCTGILKNWPNTNGGTKVETAVMLQIHSRLSDWTQKAILDWLLIRRT